MSVRVRLTRVGSKKNPIWRVVVSDQRSPRDGRFIETIGHYNPQTQPSTIVIDAERYDHWVARGAQPSNTVKKLMRVRNGSGVDTTAVAAADAEPATEPAAEDASPAEPAAPGDAEPAADAEPAPADAGGGESTDAG